MSPTPGIVCQCIALHDRWVRQGDHGLNEPQVYRHHAVGEHLLTTTQQDWIDPEVELVEQAFRERSQDGVEAPDHVIILVVVA